MSYIDIKQRLVVKNTGRGTGKTFRSVCNAYILASDGNLVVYLTQTEGARDQAFMFARAFVIPISNYARICKKVVTFSNNGAIHFMHYKEFERWFENGCFHGLKDITLLKDFN